MTIDWKRRSANSAGGSINIFSNRVINFPLEKYLIHSDNILDILIGN